MKGGYTGKLLFVDLSTGVLRETELDSRDARNFIGGYGIGCRFLYDMIPAGADPLGPENVIGFLAGPLTGTPLPFVSRFTVVGKSPLTGCWGDACRKPLIAASGQLLTRAPRWWLQHRLEFARVH